MMIQIIHFLNPHIQLQFVFDILVITQVIIYPVSKRFLFLIEHGVLGPHLT